MLSGRAVPEHQKPIDLKLTTRVPAKWVDLETSDVWAGDPDGKRQRVDSHVRNEVASNEAWLVTVMNDCKRS